MISAGPRTKADIMSGVDVDVTGSKKLANNTVEYTTESGDRVIRLHDTDIITYKKDGSVVLNSGGWKTATTKDRINDYLKIDGIDAGIYQENSLWYLTIRGPETEHVKSEWGDYDRLIHAQTVPFYDGIVIRNGRVPKKYIIKSDKQKRADEKMKKSINAYLKVVKNLIAEGLPGPEAGDCLICRLGSKSSDHLITHMREGYVPGTLLWNAMEEAGHSPHYWIACNIGKPLDAKSNVSQQIIKDVRRYIKRRVGLAP